jgi:hypothetical protein
VLEMPTNEAFPLTAARPAEALPEKPWVVAQRRSYQSGLDGVGDAQIATTSTKRDRLLK